MERLLKTAMIGVVTLSAVACMDFGTSPSASLQASDFALALAGTGESQTSFSDASVGGLTGFVSGGFNQQGAPGPGGPGGGHRGGSWMMGGGLEAGFAGYGFGNGFGHRPIDNSSCTFNATSTRLECAAVVRNGVTITRSFAFANAAGTAQTAFDSATTDRINTRSTIVGTIAGGFQRGFGHGFRHGFGPGNENAAHRTPLVNDTTTVNNASDRTVSGLRGEQRTISGTSGGTETTVGTDSVGRLTIVRVAGDTATGVKIPKTAAGGMPFPIAGNIVRSMKVTLTYDGKAAQTSLRREVIAFDGSSTATVTVTQDGSTKNCTLPLPRGRMSCS